MPSSKFYGLDSSHNPIINFSSYPLVYLAAWLRDLGGLYFDGVYKITWKVFARRYLELQDANLDLNVMISAIVDELAPELISANTIRYESTAQLLLYQLCFIITFDRTHTPDIKTSINTLQK